MRRENLLLAKDPNVIKTPRKVIHFFGKSPNFFPEESAHALNGLSAPDLKRVLRA